MGRSARMEQAPKTQPRDDGPPNNTAHAGYPCVDRRVPAIAWSGGPESSAGVADPGGRDHAHIRVHDWYIAGPEQK